MTETKFMQPCTACGGTGTVPRQRRRLPNGELDKFDTLDCVSLTPDGPPPRAIAGEPPDPLVVGPSSVAWSRAPGEAGRTIFVTTDGGHTAPPPDGRVRTAKVLRLELLD